MLLFDYGCDATSSSSCTFDFPSMVDRFPLLAEGSLRLGRWCAGEDHFSFTLLSFCGWVSGRTWTLGTGLGDRQVETLGSSRGSSDGQRKSDKVRV